MADQALLYLGTIAICAIAVVITYLINLATQKQKFVNKGISPEQKKYRTIDIVYIGVLTAISGVVFTLSGFIYQMGVAAFGPIGGGFFMFPFYWSGPLAYYLRKKVGISWIVMFLGTVAQVILGNPAGIYTIGWSLKGPMQESMFAATKYRTFKPWLWFFAGGMGPIADNLWSIYLFGWDKSIAVQYFAGLVFAFLGAGIATAIFGWALGRSIEKSRLVKVEPVPS